MEQSVEDESNSCNDAVCETSQMATTLKLNAVNLNSYMENGKEKTPPVSTDQAESVVSTELPQRGDYLKATYSTVSDEFDEANISDSRKYESCKLKSSKSKKNVSFNTFLTKEIKIDFHELGFNNWNGVPTLTKEEVLAAYQGICNEHQIDIDDDIVLQLSGVQINNNFSTVLNLLDVKITSDKLEVLEQLFQIVNFQKLYINVDTLENDAVVEIFHMLEYYNSTKELILYGNYVNDSGLWCSIAVAASNYNNDLNKLSFHELRITDSGLMSIFNSINENPNIKVLRLNGCKLNFTPIFSIATPLKNNRFLKELHLCNAELYYKETTILALFLRDNYSLKVLNLSNNKLGDRGFQVLVKALVEQTRDYVGISVLMVANNRLTKTISSPIETLLKNCPLMHSINVGCNSLTDEFVVEIKETLEICSTLKTLGLQSTLLTNEGVSHLMEVCTQNGTLQYLNLRGNRALQHEALQTIVTNLPHTHLKHVELDDANRFCTDAQEYVQILNNIRKLLIIKSSNDTSLSEKYNFTPEMALSCDIDYVPRCLSWRTPRSRGRFEVVSVPETNFSPTTSASAREVTTLASTVSSPAEVSTSKEIINWSPAYSSYSQKNTWAKMKLIDSENVQKKSDKNGILETNFDNEIIDMSSDSSELEEGVVVAQDAMNSTFDVDVNSSLVSISSHDVAEELTSHENVFLTHDALISTSSGTEHWVHTSTNATGMEESRSKNYKVSSICDEESIITQCSDAAEPDDIEQK